MTPPILFLVFNRPEPTALSFAAIRAARPSRLYVAADGPRHDRAGEAERCVEVRRIATAVDWPCDVRTLFRDENLGCKLGVAGGIDWFFAHEPEGIIIEDDIVPDPSFFAFCADLLDRYRDDPSVAIISGCNLVGDKLPVDASYAFSRYLHIWGWASWRRTWQLYDISVAGWPSAESAEKLSTVLGGRKSAIAYWSAIFDRVARGEIDTWDYQLLFAAFMNDLIAVVPATMLVNNIGFGSDATHTVGAAPALPPIVPVVRPLDHPESRDTRSLDSMIERHALGISAQRILRSWLKRALAPHRDVAKSVAS